MIQNVLIWFYVLSDPNLYKKSVPPMFMLHFSSKLVAAR